MGGMGWEGGVMKCVCMCVCVCTHVQIPKKKKTQLCTLTTSLNPVTGPDASRLCCCHRFKSKSLIDACLKMSRMSMPPLWRVKNTKSHSVHPLKCCPFLCPYVPAINPHRSWHFAHKMHSMGMILCGLLITIASNKKSPFDAIKRYDGGRSTTPPVSEGLSCSLGVVNFSEAAWR